MPGEALRCRRCAWDRADSRLGVELLPPGHPRRPDRGRDRRLPAMVFGVFSGSLLLSAVLGPAVGRAIDKRGGRGVLALSNLVLAAGSGLLALAQGIVGLAVCWAHRHVRRHPAGRRAGFHFSAAGGPRLGAARRAPPFPGRRAGVTSALEGRDTFCGCASAACASRRYLDAKCTPQSMLSKFRCQSAANFVWRTEIPLPGKLVKS
jgi:MFS family permease